MTATLLRDVELDSRRVDVLVEGPGIAAIGSELRAPPGAAVVQGAGGAVLPGLWDHHIHLLALAAARTSVVVGPPEVTSATLMEARLREAAARVGPGGWVRAVGHHPSVGGELDRWALDRLVGDRPTRVQHRSGAMWVLSSAALTLIDASGAPPGSVERDAAGVPTGRLYGADAWLRDQLPPAPAPDLTPVGSELARRGVVGVTDATPYADLADIALLADAPIAQHIVAMGGPALTEAAFPAGIGRGPVKLVLADHDLPELDRVARWVEAAHHAGRAAAFHCVSRVALALALAVLEAVGRHPGDRIEHGAVVPTEMRPLLADRRLTVVTQPAFIAERGDRYLAEVDRGDLPHLYPCQSLLDAGVAVAGSTDAPFGPADPWRAIAAAMDRRAASGAAVGAREAVDPAQALRLFLGGPHDPGGAARAIRTGAPADICLLTEPLPRALDDAAGVEVAMTMIAGSIVHEA